MARLVLAALLFVLPSCFAQGTRLYYVVFLRPDPARQAIAPAESEKIQAAHMANILKMGADGVLAAAGPFADQSRAILGIFVLKAGSLAEAKSIVAKDPTVVEHRNIVDVHAWRGPAGIGDEYARLHRENPDTPVGMGIHPMVIFLRGGASDPRALAAHDELLARLRREGKLAAGGPVEGDDAIASLVVFKRIKLEEAQAQLKDDPAQTAGVLRAEYHQWFNADHVLPW